MVAFKTLIKSGVQLGALHISERLTIAFPVGKRYIIDVGKLN
jgi:hypothetical protein